LQTRTLTRLRISRCSYLAIMGKLSLPKFGRHAEEQESSTEAPDLSISNREKYSRSMDESPVPRLTWRSLVMGAFVSIGGIIFGYDTGQISGFLEMKNYLHRYGEPDGKGAFHFTNVRSGLIVGLVS
jgi:SP family sugar:H+ symporter-like MFS transporter